MKRIVLTGFRGTGKTEIGKVIAGQMNMPLLDTDTLVEQKTGRSIPSIFHEEGEERFRAEEREVIASLPADNVVISTGGGAVIDPKNMEHLRRQSVMILLTADIDAIEPRLAHAPRPPLTSLPLREEISELLDRRRQHYYASADFCVDTSETTPEAAGKSILQFLSGGKASLPQRTTALQFFKTGRIPPLALRKLEQVLLGAERDPQTRIMGVAGFPCAHSKSPALFNSLFERYGLNYHYTWFEDPEIAEIMKIARCTDAKGLSVTIPFKVDVMEYVDEVDEHAAQPIGAVNSVVFACGTAIGYNTDWLGVRKPLVHMKGAKAVLLGAGGVAAAAAYALLDLDMDLTILNRTPATAKALAARFGCKSDEWDAFDRLKPDLVVNATPLGMDPDTRSPLTEEQIEPHMTIYDLVYTPPETPLIQAARRKGCPTVLGTELFIHQAREQFYLNFGIDVPEGIIRELVG
jgi:shikimate dehydrogenase